MKKRNFSAEFKRESAQLVVDQKYTVADAAKAMDVGLSGNDSNLLIVFYVQIMPDDFVMQLHRF